MLIPLSGKHGAGLFAIVDDDRADLAVIRWHANRNGYPMTHIDGKVRFMHHFIIGRVPGLQVDHIDGNVLNNRRANLRHVTHWVNALNQTRVRAHSRSPFIGVRLIGKKWEGRIRVGGGKRLHLGMFSTAGDADEAVRTKRAQLIAQGGGNALTGSNPGVDYEPGRFSRD